MNFDYIQLNTGDRRSVYTVWIRVGAMVCIMAAILIFFVPNLIGYIRFLNPQLPWNEESRILPEGKNPFRQLSAEQPKLNEVLHYKASLNAEGRQCGDINFYISPEGIVKGIWNGEYEASDEIHCTILAASFAGNIDSSKSCIEGNHHDPSKLYFITKGTVTMLKAGAFGNRSVNGLIYLRGWLDPNYVAAGELFITQNKKSYEVYTFYADKLI